MTNDYLESVKKQFEYYKMLGDKTFAQLNEEQLFWQFNEESNSIAMVVKHLWGNMLSRWTNFLTTDGEKEWRNRDEEFKNDIGSKEELLEKWDSGWQCLFNAITSLTSEDLAKEIYIRNQGHTVAEAINRQLAHYPYHVGQIVFLGKMLCNQNWKSLSIPKGDSKTFNDEKFTHPKHKQHFTDEFLKNKMELTAKSFIEILKANQSNEELRKILRYFKSEEGDYGFGDEFIGVKMGFIFELAKQCNQMPIEEIELLLESPIHEARTGAMSIMDKAARDKKINPVRLAEFFELYMRRHDRINNWDLVDLGCLYMTGLYLFDKDRTILYKLATSKNIWERRTAILSTCYFIRKNDLNDTFQIAEMLLNDQEDLIHKATGWMLRFAGDKNKDQLTTFLAKYAATMPRVLLRNAIEKFDKPERDYYLALKKNKI
ncbi:DUF1572 domain-containing protein [Pedobacter polaris]|uniref:DUF1572 domain-containing protein n=2 Tax=Pedobacter polaris TaxID=2571273 RepID=A0A4U1CF81_9SPHI|nr:DUF1572 domain-containing protein [Pedobacter polaris]